MCGIQGIISNSLSKNEMRNRLFNMGEIQRHRGPDDSREKIFTLEKGLLGFGFVRLSILDLDTGMQPIICPSDKSAIICNGQIYNYIELKSQVADQSFLTKGDIEVALHLFRKKGLEFLNDLNGMYAGAIYDPTNQCVVLFRDRFGIKPLYYTQYDNRFVFSSEIKPLLAGSGRPAELNKLKVPVFLKYRYLPGEETMFRGIKRLPPGSYLKYDLQTGKFIVKRYWEYTLHHEAPAMSLNEAAEEFIFLFRDSVRIRLRSDVEVGALLSGGIDSSAVASVSAELKPYIKLFTISFDEKPYNELPQVRQFINANKDRFSYAQHHTKLCGSKTLEKLPEIIRAIEEPLSLGTVLPTDQVCEMAGDMLKVVLTGEGADEIFGGYRKFLIEKAAHEYAHLTPLVQEKLNRKYPELKPYLKIRDKNPAKRYIQSDSLFNSQELKTLTGQDTFSDLFPEDALPQLKGTEDPLNIAIAFESRARLPDYVILRLDKISMKHSLETRTPFLDFRLAEFAATLPVDFKVNLEKNRTKYICSHAFAKHSILDERTAFRQKIPFTVPLAHWLSNTSGLPDFISEILYGNVIQNQGILNDKFIKNITGKIKVGNTMPHTLVSEADRLFAVIIFSLWYNEFLAK